MEKPLQRHTSYKAVSALESAIIERVFSSGLLVFGVGEASKLAGISRGSATNVLNSMLKKELVLRLARNKYCLAKGFEENSFAIATIAFNPSYVSFWTALSFYGFTEQQPNIVQLASTKQFKKIYAKSIKIQAITLKPKNFFGYVQEQGFTIASKEKALIDSALNLEQTGGFNEFAKCFKNSWNELNRKQFFEFLLKTGNKSLNSRIGFLIDVLKLKTGKNFLKTLEKNCSKGFVKLDYLGKKTGEYCSKWKIIVNEPITWGEIV